MMDERSEKNLIGVHRDLYCIVRLAAVICPIKFMVTEGLRTLERQKKLVETGASRTMNSRHITGHAVDIAALIDFDSDGDLDIRWDFGLYLQIAESMGKAATTLQLPVTWGGCWEQINGMSASDLNDAVAKYTAVAKRAGKKPLIDGPHFELPRAAYQ